MKIIIFGPQGSGKGVISEALARELNIKHISVGEILREHIKNNTPIGRQVQEYMNKGVLVPDEISNKVLTERIKQKDCKNGYILDGFPRNLVQAEALNAADSVDKAILIAVSREEVLKRIRNRRMCEKCGNISSVPWLKNGKCEKCGGEVYQREDDKQEKVVLERLNIYEKETKPILDFYRAKGILFEMKSMESVEDSIANAMKIVTN